MVHIWKGVLGWKFALKMAGGVGTAWTLSPSTEFHCCAANWEMLTRVADELGTTSLIGCGLFLATKAHEPGAGLSSVALASACVHADRAWLIRLNAAFWLPVSDCV